MKPKKIKGYDWQVEIDYRKNPERYKMGRGEQGVLICEPYKSEILPYWRFKTPEIATKSSRKIYKLFLHYLAQNDFVGADMARKYLQMGYTRARRYANYKGGLKYSPEGELLARGTGDPDKAISATIFYKQWRCAEANPSYKKQKKLWKLTHG